MAGIASPTAIANVASARIDFVMTLLPALKEGHSEPQSVLQVYGQTRAEAISDFSVI